MTFTDVLPAEGKSAETGIKLGVMAGRSSDTARLTFNASAQKEIFGALIHGRRFRARVGRGQDEGRLLLIEDSEGDLEATRLPKDAACIRMKAWDLLPKGRTPAGSCVLVEPAQGGLILQLPSFTRPSRPGGRMEQEHGLKTQS